VAERHVIGDGQHEVHAYRIDNPHADGADPRLRAGRAPGLRHRHLESGRRAAARQAQSRAGRTGGRVKKAGIEPTRFADYAPLAALEGK
jgi:hypothetical protein